MIRKFEPSGGDGATVNWMRRIFATRSSIPRFTAATPPTINTAATTSEIRYRPKKVAREERGVFAMDGKHRENATGRTVAGVPRLVAPEPVGEGRSGSLRPVTAAFRTLALRCGIALLVCAVATTAAVVAANRYIDSKIAAIPRIALATATSAGHGTNYLVIGSDSRSFVHDAGAAAAFGTSADTGPARSDTMMVLHVDGANSFGLSFPRDLWVDIPGRGKAKINAAFNDGPQKVIDTLKQDFGVDIDHYLEVNFV